MGKFADQGRHHRGLADVPGVTTNHDSLQSGFLHRHCQERPCQGSSITPSSVQPLTLLRPSGIRAPWVRMSHMIQETIPVGMLQCNCYILGDEATGEAVVRSEERRVGK